MSRSEVKKVYTKDFIGQEKTLSRSEIKKVNTKDFVGQEENFVKK